MKYHFLKSLFKSVLPKTLYIFNTGQIPEGAMGQISITHASAASNAANATFGGAGVPKLRAPQDMRIVSAWWGADDGNQAVTQTVSHRRVSLIDGGADATGTKVLGSVNLSVSLASNNQRAMTLLAASLATIDQGDVLYMSHATVGGTDDPDTELSAGTLQIAYKSI